MAQVISFLEVRQQSAAPGPHSPRKVEAKAYDRAPETPSGEAPQQLPGKEDIFRAVQLLDLAVLQARVLVKHVIDPSRRENFEAQITSIQQLLQLTRGLALKL